MVPLYNHVLMALPATEENLAHLKKEILSFLWNRTDEADTQKILLVAVKQVSASFDKRELQIQHPHKTQLMVSISTAFMNTPETDPNSNTHFTRTMKGIKEQEGHPSLQEHINTMCPTGWTRTHRTDKDTQDRKQNHEEKHNAWLGLPIRSRISGQTRKQS
jgi:hypothetical protein